ncbi:Transcription elongation factor spt6 [Rhizoctonia solani]|uniref:Transcription elongation factor Spt6 n=1 Tax=Rhizoctonia solani TaxID=456999 RepID=A0A8H7LMK8_9AGAM|nr:Transcription elongation factor Spt6 [Rhizoctonia solani]
MSSPAAILEEAMAHDGEHEEGINDVEMGEDDAPGAEDAEGEDEEGEGDGDAVGAEGAASDDSSEEGEDDEAEARRVREGFIVDEDEDDEEDSEAERRRRRRRKKRRKHREMEEDLDEDDLDLVEENTGTRASRSHLTRLRRGRASSSRSASPEETRISRGRRPRGSDDESLPDANDIDRIWDDRAREEDDGDMDDFIEDDLDEDPGMGEEEREEQRRERRRVEKERRKAMGARPELAGIDAGAWDEIFEVFGDGTDYDWALDDEDLAEEYEPISKPDLTYNDVFEPSEIRARHLTLDDDIIRVTDIPERMQLTNSTLADAPTLVGGNKPFSNKELDEAAEWVALRLSKRTQKDYFQRAGKMHHYLMQFILAVRNALDYVVNQYLEIPYIWVHRRDYISHFELRQRVELLTREELWKVGILGLKFRALLERRSALEATFRKLEVQDEYFEKQLLPNLTSISMVADATEWLSVKYKQRKKDIEATADDMAEKKHKNPSRVSAYEVARGTIVSRLADDFGLPPHQIAINFSGQKVHFPDDQDLPPRAYAEQFITESCPTAEEALTTARMIIATELGRDPQLREAIRNQFKEQALLSCEPTEKGKTKIDEAHACYGFKFLVEKPIETLTSSPQYLHILGAESELLLNVEITATRSRMHEITTSLENAYASDSFSDSAKAWNEQRRAVIAEALEKHLIPQAITWTKEWLREEVEDYLANKAAEQLEKRVNMSPCRPKDLVGPDDVPSAVSMSWGKGEPNKDPIHLVYLDEEGRFREHLRLDNLSDADNRQEFLDLLKRRKPDVIVIGGFTVATKHLMSRAREALGIPEPDEENESGGTGASTSAAPAQSGNWGGGDAGGGWGSQNNAGNGGGWGSENNTGASAWGGNQASEAGGWGSDNPNTAPAGDKPASQSNNNNSSSARNGDERVPELMYGHDEVARIYQHSPRAEAEFSALPLVARYCVSLARYVQNPLNEYAALGSDLTAVTFTEAQNLIPKDKLLVALERAIVNIVNNVGVDINRAVNDPYHRTLLPYVAGLGPRKSEALIKKLGQIGGTVVNRSNFIKQNLVPTQIFINCCGFLYVPQDPDSKEIARVRDHYEDVPDPLDETRIHYEDYDLARKMALDALEMDDEDVVGKHPSVIVYDLMQKDDNVQKLEELSLDDFAQLLKDMSNEQKRHTLNMIREELLRPFGDQRESFVPPDEWKVMTMLSGETVKTLAPGRVISVSVLRIMKSFVSVRLDSGVDGIINLEYVDREPGQSVEQVLRKGQTIQAVIIAINLKKLSVELSARATDIEKGDAQTRMPQFDQYYDKHAAQRLQDELHRKKMRAAESSRRIIKHPNFHNFNATQAHQYLANQHRGDVVIRPSSKGPTHLAVTWKVDEGVYQHIDVVDPSGNAGDQSVGKQLIIDGKYEYSDLDELIVNHVNAMARKVEELIAHEKYKAGSEAELHKALKEFVIMHPTKSIYAFGLNRSKPGYFNLSFLANKNAPIQTWPVRVIPEGYVLIDTPVPTVPDLCNAFKMRYSTPQTTARTPAYGAGRMTPGGARTPGHRTPGHPMGGKTPNPYATGGKTPNPYAARTPNPYAGQQQASGGWGAPPPAGMNPDRARMINANTSNNGNNSSNGSGWGASNNGENQSGWSGGDNSGGWGSGGGQNSGGWGNGSGGGGGW